MRRITKMTLGVMFVLFTVAAMGFSAAVADGEVEMVFHVEGMR